MAMERQQRMQKQQQQEENSQKKQIFSNDLNSVTVDDNSVKESHFQKKELKFKEQIQSGKNNKQESKSCNDSSSQSVHTQLDTQFYINKLKNYPEEQHTDYMLDFQQLFAEDPFFKKNGKEAQKTAQSVFITTYGFSSEHLLSIANKKDCNFVLANDRRKEDLKTLPSVIPNYCNYSNWTLIHPPKEYNQPFPGPFHPKLWLIKFPGFLRVVITSGNQMAEDWVSWSQGIWFQDFQKKNLSQMGQMQQQQLENKFDFSRDFEETLQEFVQKLMPQGCEYRKLLQMNLQDYVYNNVNVILIPGIPGRHAGKELGKYNKGKVKRVLKHFKGETKIKTPTLTYQTTSCGKVDEDFIEEMINIFTPQSKDFPLLQGERKQRKKNKMPIECSKNMKLIYPTLEYILNEAQLGVELAQPLCMQKDYFLQEAFPKRIMHRFEGNEEYFFHHGVIPHIKVGILTDEELEITDDSVIYFGSHNFSQAAWGRLEKDMTQINNNNTELGILFPPMVGSKQIKSQFISCLPFKYPPTKYQGKDRPFMWGDMQR